MNEANSSFFKDERLIQLFNRYGTYSGSNPYLAPATLNIISHVEYNQGSFIPVGGIHSITKALWKLAEKKGVNIFLNQKVDEIILENQEATGIRIGDNVKKYDKIISNVDVNFTFKYLIKNFDNRESKRYSKKRPSFSGLVFYWGIKKEFPEFEIHNILFSKDYKKEFDDLFEIKRFTMIPQCISIFHQNLTKMMHQQKKKIGLLWLMLLTFIIKIGMQKLRLADTTSLKR